jgi:hypothetical protein
VTYSFRGSGAGGGGPRSDSDPSISQIPDDDEAGGDGTRAHEGDQYARSREVMERRTIEWTRPEPGGTVSGTEPTTKPAPMTIDTAPME